MGQFFDLIRLADNAERERILGRFVDLGFQIRSQLEQLRTVIRKLFSALQIGGIEILSISLIRREGYRPAGGPGSIRAGLARRLAAARLLTALLILRRSQKETPGNEERRQP